MAAKLSLKKKLLFISILTLVPLVAVVAAGELYVRMFSSSGYYTPAIIKNRSLRYQSSVFSRAIYPQGLGACNDDDPAYALYTWDDREPQYFINNQGYRGDDFDVKKQPGTIRIMIYGGSHVFDMNARGSKHWPRLIQNELRDRGYNVQVINAGVMGMASADSVGRFFSEGHMYQPDIVILCNMWNDIKHFYRDDSLLRYYTPYQDGNDPRVDYLGNWDQTLCETSQLYVRVRQKLINVSGAYGDEGKTVAVSQDRERITDEALAQYRLNLQTFCDIATNVKAKPILMIQDRLVASDNSPEEHKIIRYDFVGKDHKTLLKAFDLTDQITHQVAQEKGVTLIDPTSILTGNGQYYTDHVHTTPEGSQILAKFMADQLEPHLNKQTTARAE